MRRVVILGPGGAGKSVLAARLAAATGLPLIELDKVFWKPGLVASTRAEWVARQQQLTRDEGWIMDGELGPYDALEVRLQAADTVILLDLPMVVCVWRALRRGRERWDFWWWLLRYPFVSRPVTLKAIRTYAPGTTLHVLRSPRAVEAFLARFTA